MAKRRRIENEAQHPSEGTRLLQDLSRIRGTTRAALSDILKRIAAEPNVDVIELATNVSERCKAAEGALFERSRLEFKFENGFVWELADSCKLVADLYQESSTLRSVIGKALSQHPCSQDRPWTIVMGFDEYTPGSSRKPNNCKKAMVLSWSCLQLGAEALSKSVFWFTPIVVRHNFLLDVEGGWRRCFSLYLEHFLVGPRGITTAGLPLENPDGSHHVLFAKLRIVLADGDGLREAFGWKGARGLKCCIRHTNVWALSSDMAHRSEGQVEITCSNAASFKTAKKTDYVAIVDALAEATRSHAEGRMTNGRYKNITMVLGFNHVPTGVLQNANLREAFDSGEVITYDWMHTYLQDGILSKEAWQVVRKFRQFGYNAPELQTFFKSFQFPTCSKRDGGQLHSIFNTYRAKSNEEADKLKTSASELLSIYSLLRHFLDAELPDASADVEPSLASFNACCACVDVILAAKRGRIQMKEAASLLRDRQQRHMELNELAHGNTMIVPKFQWQFDISEQLDRDSDLEFLADAFIIERIHLRIKPVAEAHDNTARYEAGVLAGVIASHRRDLEHVDLGDGLRGRKWRMPGAPGTILSKAMCVNGASVAVGDIVTNGESFGIITACAFEGSLLVVVDVLEIVAKISTYGWRCKRLDVRRSWDARGIASAVAWKREGDCLVVLGS